MSQEQTQKTEICGEETNNGGKCQNNKESCPWHNEDTTPNNGRPSKFTEERRQKIIEAAEEGLPMRSLARAAGIGTSTLYEWMEDNPDFSEQVKQARTKAELKLAKEVKKKDPRYILTRSFKWDKPSADTVINNQMMQKQKQESVVMERLQQAYEAKMENQDKDSEKSVET